jgi:hypothetical protein
VGKGTSSNLSPQIQPEMLANETALVNLAQQSAQEGQQLYNLTEPGLARAENFYSSLSSGDPAAIMQAIAPAAQQINQATAGAKKNILQTPGGGGEKNLALENADVSRGAEIGQTASGAYTGSFNALGQLAGQGIGESQGATGQATSAYSAGTSALSSLGNLQLENAQLQMQQKGQSLGGFDTLLSLGGAVGGAVAGGGGWEAALAALAA